MKLTKDMKVDASGKIRTRHLIHPMGAVLFSRASNRYGRGQLASRNVFLWARQAIISVQG